MGLSLKREPKFPPRRPRTAVQIQSVLLMPDDSELPVAIKNISSRGFMGVTRLDLAPGTSFGIDIPGYGIVRAHVRWTEQNKWGAHFDRPLDLEWVEPDAPR